MKFRNFLIVLLAVLMVFAFASCNNNPEPKKETGKIYKLTATTGRDSSWNGADKFILHFSGTELETGLEDGDVFSFMFRSTRDFSQYSVRNSKCAWEYEQTFESSEGGNLLLEEGEDGWTTVTYTFSTSPHNGSKTAPDYNNPDHIGDFRFDLRGSIIVGDYVEIKEVTFNGYDLALTKENVPDHSNTYYGAVNPTFSIVNDHEWTVAKTYVVYYTTESLGDGHNPDYVETVAQGDTILADIDREHYTFKLYTSSSFSDEFDAEKAITKDTTIYVKYTGDPMTVTFNVGETGSAVTSQTVEYGTYATKPETDPTNTNENLVFAGWYVGDSLFDFATTQILADTEIVAKWGAPVAVTFDAENGAEDEETVVIVASGCPVAEPTDPTFGSKIFEGWFLGEATEAYDFSTPVTAAITLKAKWTNATTVTLNPNFVGAPEAKTISAELDVALDPKDIEFDCIRPGFVFAGWYDDAECKTAHDFSKIVTDAFTLYADWTDGTIYKMVATNGDGGTTYDKFILDWQDGSVTVKKDDTLAFAYRTTVDFQMFNIRDDETTTDSQKGKWVYESDSSALTSHVEGSDGWIYVTYTFTADRFVGAKDTDPDIAYPAVFRFDFISKNIRPGDVLEVKGITLNGEEIDLPKVDKCATSFTELEAIDEWTTHEVTFNTDGGSTVAPVTAEFGERIAKPEDPTKADVVFDGWYADQALTKEFRFADTPITKDTVVYAKFIDAWTVTLNLNYGETPATKAVYVDKGTVMSAPKGIGRVGYFLEGWYDDADCMTAHDFTAAVTGDTTIYANWVEPTEAYLFTATVDEERFQFRWHEDAGFFANGQIQPGDVFTLMIKFPEGNSSAEKTWRLRTRSTEAHITEDIKFSNTTKDADGWYLITAVAPAGIGGNGLYLQVYENSNAKVGDKMIIKAFAYNGEAIEVDARPFGTASTSKGAYSKVKADGEVVNPDGTPKAE